MNINSKSEKLAGVSILSAVAASLCCITPVLALISGASGVASAFSWMEPFRSYLIAITVLILGFTWYQKLKPSRRLSGAEEIQCACEEEDKTPFMQTKKNLGIATVFAILMMAFPYYGHFFYPKAGKLVVSSDNMQEVKFNMSGMTCASCEEHVKNEVNKLPGIINVSANSKEGNVFIKFDNSKTNKEAIINAIDATGYKVSGEIVRCVNPAHGQAGHGCGPNGCK